jgi:hypothetical protein
VLMGGGDAVGGGLGVPGVLHVIQHLPFRGQLRTAEHTGGAGEQGWARERGGGCSVMC